MISKLATMYGMYGGDITPKGEPLRGFDGVVVKADVDFSQIELRLMAQTLENRQARWNQIQAFPGLLHYVRLRKSRARLIAEAVKSMNTLHSKGNFSVLYVPNAEAFLFRHRETFVMTWNPVTDTMKDVDAGVYEHTSSTRNQRRLIREAIEEFNKAVLG